MSSNVIYLDESQEHSSNFIFVLFLNVGYNGGRGGITTKP